MTRPGRTQTIGLEGWFIVAVFVLISASRWFTGAGDDNDYTRGSALAQAIWGVVYAAAIYGLLRCRPRTAALLRRTPVIAILMVVAAASTFWSIDAGITAKRAIGLVGTTAFAYYLAARFTLPEFVRILIRTCWIVAAASLVAAVAFPAMGVMHDEYDGAWRGIFIHKNFLGEFMGLAILTFVAALMSEPQSRRWNICGLLFCIVLLVKSQSATSLAIAAASCGLAMCIVLYRSSPWGRVITTLGAGTLFFSAAGIVAYGVDPQSALSLLGRDATLTGRTDIWSGVVQAISMRPWLGYGYDVFWLPNGDFPSFLNFGSYWRPDHAHDGFLEVMLDLGIVGCILSCVALLQSLVRSVLLLRRGLGESRLWPLLTTLCFIFLNATESTIAKYNDFSWIIFVVGMLYATTVVPNSLGAYADDGRAIPAGA